MSAPNIAAEGVTNPSIDDLLTKTDSKYKLVLYSAKRARQVRARMPDALFVFLKPPSWDELVRRLVGRGTESEEERRRRLDTAVAELAAESEFDVTIINREVRAAAEELVALMLAHRP